VTFNLNNNNNNNICRISTACVDAQATRVKKLPRSLNMTSSKGRNMSRQQLTIKKQQNGVEFYVSTFVVPSVQ